MPLATTLAVALLFLISTTAQFRPAAARRDPSDAARAMRTRRAVCARDHARATSDDALLACVSPRCRDAVYGADPLEEGEFCHRRMAIFEACVREEIRGRPPRAGAG
jgi:Domain of unknown function (DUF4787)